MIGYADPHASGVIRSLAERRLIIGCCNSLNLLTPIIGTNLPPISNPFFDLPFSASPCEGPSVVSCLYKSALINSNGHIFLQAPHFNETFASLRNNLPATPHLRKEDPIMIGSDRELWRDRGS